MQVTYNYTVGSVTNTIVNSFNLRVLTVAYTTTSSSSPAGLQIMERFGGISFMFNFMNKKQASDGDWLTSFLCYQDDEFGLKQFTQTDCMYETAVGLEENIAGSDEFRLFPNPATTHFNVSMPNSPGGDLQLCFSDVFGREVKRITPDAGIIEHRINMKDLSHGVYIVSLMKDGEVVYKAKVVKQD